jgi:hypothetical protein
MRYMGRVFLANDVNRMRACSDPRETASFEDLDTSIGSMCALRYSECSKALTGWYFIFSGHGYSGSVAYICITRQQRQIRVMILRESSNMFRCAAMSGWHPKVQHCHWAHKLVKACTFAPPYIETLCDGNRLALWISEPIIQTSGRSSVCVRVADESVLILSSF